MGLWIAGSFPQRKVMHVVADAYPPTNAMKMMEPVYLMIVQEENFVAEHAFCCCRTGIGLHHSIALFCPALEQKLSGFAKPCNCSTLKPLYKALTLSFRIQFFLINLEISYPFYGDFGRYHPENVV